MARRGYDPGTTVSDLYRCICDGCRLQIRCRDHQLFCRDRLLGDVNGYNVECPEYQPECWHGLEEVKP